MNGTFAMVRAAPAEPCRPWPRHLLGAAEWLAMRTSLAEPAAPALLALWADAARVHALLGAADGFLIASTAVDGGRYPALSPFRPAAAWFERIIRDLWGHEAEGGGNSALARPRQVAPHDPTLCPPAARARSSDPLEFLPVEGEDTTSLPSGRCRARSPNPAHFRLSVLGETVVRLELRLGWLHKGTLGLMRGKSPRAAARFAARLSGDSTVAHSLAFARAAEAAAEAEAPPRAAALRAVMAELERMANHLLDCAAIAEAAACPALAARLGELASPCCAPPPSPSATA